MSRFPSLLAASALALALAGCATSGMPGGVAAKDGVLVGPNGMTLYTFDRDPVGGGKSVCNGPCARNWPPLLAGTATPSGDFTTVQRDEGGAQLAYKGKPLYYWVKDTQPGERTGDGVNQVWRTAKP
ncbi:hypothetical protein M4R22_18765 [Acidovorax sp. GBBC 3334]|uniref:COG4315 family predicted lipoprotein n=1 Tax=unclassified Acidovorax TaxID=2684926 RepID=UPI002304735D|nr:MULTISPECIES: hypothetical protein [unclassified Acidovorax]MDA8456807.1 hypothetical protein [Acidovorax sp. GBBC 3334]MDA8520369.1 hypothetical protein [Acidovorax sp. NCPPB 4044]